MENEIIKLQKELLKEKDKRIFDLNFKISELNKKIKKFTNKNDEFLDRKLDGFDFSVRTSNALRLSKFYTIRDLIVIEKSWLMKHKNMGSRTICELENFMERYCLSFK